MAACLILGACATSDGSGPPAAVLAEGYLDGAALDQLAAASVPSPFVPGNEPSDHANFGPGTDRWWLAIAHAELRPPEAAQHFDCILGTRLAEKPRPALTRLMTRLLIDTDRLTRQLAEAHPRARPVAVDRNLQPCQRITDAMRDSPSWPAGGAVAGAAYGEMFAQLAPDQAEALRARGAEIGFSRAVCRMNWMADSFDGAEIGKAVYAQAAQTPAFAADLEAARAELTAARAEGLTNPACAAERRALRRTGY
nr:PA-phosphatase [Brevundimonas lenta]